MTFESTLESLADPDQRLTSGLLLPLSGLEREQALELREEWPEIDAQRRIDILRRLAELIEDNVDLNYDAIFRLGLDDEEPELRIVALQGLYEYEGRDLIPLLVAMLLDDDSVDVRKESAIALGRYSLEAELGHLSEADSAMVRDVLMENAENLEEDEQVRAKSIEALGAMSDEEIANLIESIYEEDSIFLKVGAVDAMGRSCDDVWLPTVLREMENKAPVMRHAAAFAAGLIGDESAIANLQRAAIMDPDKEVRHAAVRALGEIGGQRANVALKAVLFEGHDELRGAVEEAMQEIAFNDDPLRPI